jgi:DNA-binding IclR family transcriptional regulator
MKQRKPASTTMRPRKESTNISRPVDLLHDTSPPGKARPPRSGKARTVAPAPPGLIPGLVDAEELATDRQFATNLARGLQVLRAFLPADAMLGNREICERTRLPKATVSRLTYTLTLLGYLTRVERYQKYRLGSSVLSLGYPLLASLQVRQVARPYMERIARDTGCTLNLGMRDRLDIVYVDTCRADAGNLYQPDIGSTRPLLLTAMGRALLLSAPAAERTAVLNRMKVQDPARHAAEVPFLAADEKRLRAHGYCLSRGDWQREVHAVAVPVRHREEGIAINATMSSFRLRKDFLEKQVAPQLLEAALRIGQASGFH